MKRILVAIGLSLCSVFTSFAHQTDTIPPKTSIDTIQEGVGAIDTNSYYHRDTAWENQSMRRNIESIYHLQQENSSRQKKAAMTRIIFGVAMLVVLVIGLMRKKKTAR